MNWDSVRKDFPALEETRGGKRNVYFDNACNTLRPRQVIESIVEYYERHPGCAGKRSSHLFSKETEEKCAKARESVAAFINAKASEIVWVKNSTEALNLVANSMEFGKEENTVCSILDHHSLILPFHRKSPELKIIECNREGNIPVEKWQEAIGEKTRAVLITHASNVTGGIQPAKEIVKIAHENNAVAVVDGAQFAPHFPLDVKELDADFYCFSMHKMLGPSGMGVLYGKEEMLNELDNFLVGGDTIRDVEYRQERIHPEFLPAPKKFEAGLQNYAGIIGTGAAIEYLKGIGMEKIAERDEKLAKELIAELEKFKEVEIIGAKNEKERTATVSFILKKGISPKDVAEYLDTELKERRIMLRAGSHCANPFHYFLGLNPKKGDGTIRASLYFYNTEEEVRIFGEEFGKLIGRLG